MENAQQNNLVGQIVRPGVVSGFQNDENAQPGVVYGFRTVGDYGCYSDGLGAMYIFGRTKARAMVEYENEIEGQLQHEINMGELIRNHTHHKGLNSPGHVMVWARVPDVHTGWYTLSDVLKGFVIPTVEVSVPVPIITNHLVLGSNFFSVSNVNEEDFGIWINAHLHSRDVQTM